VQAEHVGDRLHLVVIGFVQPDPDERLPAMLANFTDLGERRGMWLFTWRPAAVDVDAAVDHRLRNGT